MQRAQDPHVPQAKDQLPLVRHMGLDGLLVSFSHDLNQEANKSALAFMQHLRSQEIDGFVGFSVTLASTYIQFDPQVWLPSQVTKLVRDLLAQSDWQVDNAQKPQTLWTIPAAFGGQFGPHLDEVCAKRDMEPKIAIAELTAQPVQVMCTGFLPGLPYMGVLPERWNIARRTGLTPNVPQGAIGLAMRQLLIFPRATQTGWHHIGQTAFSNFEPDRETVMPISMGDFVQFQIVAVEEMEDLLNNPKVEFGGAKKTELSPEQSSNTPKGN